MADINYSNVIFDEKTGKLIGLKAFNKHYDLNGPLWEIEVIDNNNQKSILTIDNVLGFKFKYKANIIELIWENNEINVLVTLQKVQNKLLWNISVNTNSYKLNKIFFPKFNNLDCLKEGKDQLIIPYQGGWLLNEPVQKFIKNITEEIMPFWMARGNGYFEADYPTTLNFQFSSYTSEKGTGLYFATEDGNAYTKSFVYGSKNDHLSFNVINYPEGMGKTHSYCMPYNFVTSFFEGGYENAVELYREWAIKQKWCQKELSEKELPQSILNIDLWRINHTNYALGTRTQEYFNTCQEIQKLTGANLGIHWYGWNMGEHDVDYPCYISEDDYKKNWDKTLTEWNKKFDEIGVTKIPYVNARLWDKYNASYNKENAHHYALKDENGNTYCEPWKGDGLIPMCPSTHGWQQKVSDFCNEYVEDLGFDGIYLDQIASFRATLCFDETHPHAVGGGC